MLAECVRCGTDKNINHVPKKAWSKWNDSSRRVFNRMYRQMMAGPELFKHPGAPKPKPIHWKVLAWNTAWIAADEVESETRK